VEVKAAQLPHCASSLGLAAGEQQVVCAACDCVWEGMTAVTGLLASTQCAASNAVACLALSVQKQHTCGVYVRARCCVLSAS
jgi:hypothetical protein